jgi:hypothetical protein
MKHILRAKSISNDFPSPQKYPYKFDHPPTHKDKKESDWLSMQTMTVTYRSNTWKLAASSPPPLLEFLYLVLPPPFSRRGHLLFVVVASLLVPSP